MLYSLHSCLPLQGPVRHTLGVPSRLQLGRISKTAVTVALGKWGEAAVKQVRTSDEADNRLGLLDGKRYAALQIAFVEHFAARAADLS